MKYNQNIVKDHEILLPENHCYLIYKHNKKFIHGICYLSEEDNQFYVLVINELFNQRALYSTAIKLSSLNKKYYKLFGNNYMKDLYPKIYQKLQKRCQYLLLLENLED